ncbi:HAD family hydrolase [Halobellus salinisoli]|uniref:HAD family hydrolase n=1 Tax=Halobellus salinisoli TaxID=3108500 RepID=UPI0030081FD7
MTDVSRAAETETRPLEAFDAVVWDLDGTLVRLRVDWDVVTRDVADVFEAAGIAADGVDLWEMLDLADESGLRNDVEAVIGEHEDAGARRSDRLPHADLVGGFDAEGVCSLNCERACRIALDIHELTPHVDAVVGRDTIPTRKPDPEPLLETIRRMDVSTGETVFVGDSVRDEEAARRAGVAFRYVEKAVSDDGVSTDS